MLLVKAYGADAMLVIDKIQGNYVYGRKIELDDNTQSDFKKYLLRHADGKPDCFIYGSTSQKIVDFEKQS